VPYFIVRSISRPRSPSTRLTAFQKGNSSPLEAAKRGLGERDRPINERMDGCIVTMTRGNIAIFHIFRPKSIVRSVAFPHGLLNGFPRENSSLLGTASKPIGGRNRSIDKEALGKRNEQESGAFFHRSIHQSIALSQHLLHGSPRGKLFSLGNCERGNGRRDRPIEQ